MSADPSPSIPVPGFTVTAVLHRGPRRSVFRARQESDGRSVVLKTATAEYPTPAEIAALRREYEVLRQLDLPGVVRAEALLQRQGRVTLVLADAGQPLREALAAGALTIDRFFEVARALVRILADVHAAGFVHKDINPGNILIDAGSGAITLADFGAASRLEREAQLPAPPLLLEGTLAYLSPEQTGRMNRDVDYRSDFYSLGVTFYELLTGVLPFAVLDPLELIHHHLARTPVPPDRQRAGVPSPLAAMVMRLMAKSPEERYQSATGIAADLDRYAAEWRATGRIADTPLGGGDVADRFVLPQRLYGREAEIAEVQSAFTRVAQGGVELLLVSGYSGIGKTSLVHELYKSLAGSRGHFVTGKFDQLVRDVPYRAVIQAFGGLVDQLLSGSDAEVATWGRRLQAAVGGNGQLLIDVLPGLERIIGPQPPVPTLDGTEAQHRFNLVVQHFVGALAAPEHPLVVFFDDLQWADLGTLTLLPEILVQAEVRGLLVIGAYRANEVTATHPMTLAVDDLRNRGAIISEVVLEALDAGALTELVADTLRVSPGEAAEAADAITAKTGGNPFFVTQFLRTLHQDGLLRYDYAARRWNADVEGIRRMQITENVVDLMTAKLQRMEAPTQRMLRTAACIGNRFDLETLAVIAEETPDRCLRQLWPAVEQGLVLTEATSYGFLPDLAAGLAPAAIGFRFLHDRVQQAAYAMIPAGDRSAAHLAVGRLLLAHLGDTGAQLFEVVNHLNIGSALMDSSDERRRLAELNLTAGRRAKASAAYPSALAYFEAGAGLLGGEGTAPDTALAFALELERAEAGYLCGRYEESEARFHALLPRCPTVIERAEVTALLMIQYETMARYGDAIRTGIEGLEALGVSLPRDPAAQRAAIEEDLRTIEATMAGREVSALLELPPLAEPRLRRALTLLIGIWAPAYISGAGGLHDLVATRMVRISLEHGNCEESAFGYVAFATTVGYHRGAYHLGYQFGRLALALNAKLADPRFHPLVHHRFAALVNPMVQPYATSLPHAQEAVRTALEGGNLHVAGYAQFQQSWYGILIEESLGAFLAKVEPQLAFLARLQNPAFLQGQRLILHWAYALQGRTERPTSLNAPGLDEEEFLRTIGRIGIFRGLFVTLKLELLNLHGEIEPARALARDEAGAAEVFVGSVWPVLFAFQHVLALTAWLPSAPAAERAEAERTLATLLERLQRWAAHAPENFRLFEQLAMAEIARVRQQPGDAVAAYEEALQLVAAQATPRYRALANELYGRFWLERGQSAIAAVFLREARFAYGQWGAVTKVADLDRGYHDLFARALPTRAPAERPGILQTTDALSVTLDLAEVFRAAHAISGELDLDTLVPRLMHVVLEGAGADHGALVLEGPAGPRVRVIGTMDGATLLPDGGPGLDGCAEVPASLVQYVRRTRESVVIGDAFIDPSTAGDPYVQARRPRALLVTPVIGHGALVGVLVLENRLTPDAFTAGNLRVTQFLSAQAAIALRNAELFAEVVRLRDRLQAENVYLQEEIKTQIGFEEIIGSSAGLQRNLRQVEQVAPTTATVLIRGETGTGKELLARAIHTLSPRRDRPMVSVNCGAISPGLVESELFGHEKGAFTGAIARKIGRFELADGGTLFLDEIGDLTSELQVKLLRVLQEGEFERVGGSRPIRVDVRVIAATHRDLRRMVQEGGFRQDLFYRLNVFPIDTPPLRERREDIPTLVRHFVLRHGAKLGRRIETIPQPVLQALTAYDWPGNVRELANVIERSVIISRGNVLELGDWGAVASQGTEEPEPTLQDTERRAILRALERTGWVVSGARGAARILGLKSTTLEARMKKLGIRRPASEAG